MKNKVIALSLLITALSVVPTFADTNSNCNTINLNSILSNSNIIKKGVNVSQLCDLLPSQNTKNTNVNISDIISKYFSNSGNKDCDQNVTKPNGGTTTKPSNPGSNQGSNQGGGSNQGTTKPGTTKPDTTKPDTTKPDTTKPDTTKPSQGNGSSTNSSVSSYERQVVELVNAERAKNGLSALTLDSSVSKVARAKSQDMATNNYFSHTSPTYGNAGSMLKQFGIKYTAYGENIASGQKTPQQVVTAWMNSSGHRANILSSTFTKIGVGYVTNSSGKAYWTQMFIR